MSQSPKLSELKELADRGDWQKLLSICKASTSMNCSDSAVWLFKGYAEQNSNLLSDSAASISKALELSPNSTWGHKLLFDTQLKAGLVGEALDSYASYLKNEKGSESENEKRWYVEQAASRGFYKQANKINEIRNVIREPGKKLNYAVAVQCFIKPDTLNTTLEALTKTTGSDDFGLVILQDAPADESRHAVLTEQVMTVIAHWIPKLSMKFGSIEVIRNSQNLGTAPTCRRLLDIVSERYSGFLFLEDDCTLGVGALRWAKYNLDEGLDSLDSWLFCCESIFFNSSFPLTDELTKTRLSKLANSNALRGKYVGLDFVPSTCFGTTSSLWKMCAGVRSFTRGPESLTGYLRKLGKKTVAPVVPHAADVGMLHKDGYSLSSLGIEGLKEVKNCYLLASEFLAEDYAIYKYDLDLLFAATCKLNDDAIARIEKAVYRTHV